MFKMSVVIQELQNVVVNICLSTLSHFLVGLGQKVLRKHFSDDKQFDGFLRLRLPAGDQHVSAQACDEGVAGQASEVSPAHRFRSVSGGCNRLQVHGDGAQEKGLRRLLQTVRRRQRVQRHEGSRHLRERAAVRRVKPRSSLVPGPRMKFLLSAVIH